MVEYKAPLAAMAETIPQLQNYAAYLQDVLAESEQEAGKIRGAWDGDASVARHEEHTAWLAQTRQAHEEVLDRLAHLKLAHETYTHALRTNTSMFED